MQKMGGFIQKAHGLVSWEADREQIWGRLTENFYNDRDFCFVPGFNYILPVEGEEIRSGCPLKFVWYSSDVRKPSRISYGELVNWDPDSYKLFYFVIGEFSARSYEYQIKRVIGGRVELHVTITAGSSLIRHALSQVSSLFGGNKHGLMFYLVWRTGKWGKLPVVKVMNDI